MNPLSIRSSGILLHPTSLPGPHGCGDFGESAYRFVDWLVSAGQSCWQMLPLGEVGACNSPYMSSSAFAGSILLIDPDELVEQGWLKIEELPPVSDASNNKVDYDATRLSRSALLRLAENRFRQQGGKRAISAFEKFCDESQHWLDDYALFKAIWASQAWRDWNTWPDGLAKREKKALQAATASLAAEVGFWKFCQWCYDRQWRKLKHYANANGVHLIGDVPIFVAYQSADVWAHQHLFKLDADGCPTVVAGVPPDYFSKTGQLWGNPIYHWEQHAATGYTWWIARMKHMLQQFDVVRVDHFRGFANYWAVSAGESTAINGEWNPGPGEELFNAFKQVFRVLPIIAEDLGLITPDVIALRDKFNLPGMRILQFAFGEDERNYFLPHHYVANAVAYTGTHDNDTSIGWWNSAGEHEKEFARRYLNCDGSRINWDMIKALSASVANTVIYPLQDVIGLDGAHRMNFPGKARDNWEWRFTWEQLAGEETTTLAAIIEKDRRNPRLV
ncbi:MAG: 4-alpha-glucanotransferase [Sideroxydans sp.]